MRGLYRRERSAYWWMCYRSKTGKLIRRSTGQRTKRAAAQVFESRRLEDSLAKPKKRITYYTLNQLITAYLPTVRHQHSFRSKKLHIERVAVKLGRHRLQDLTAAEVESYRAKRLDSIKPSTANREIAALKHALNYAVSKGWMTEEERLRVAKVKQLREDNACLRYLSQKEIGKLLAACQSKRRSAHIYPIVVLALHTGMRRGEILGLLWRHVDLSNKWIVLPRTKSGKPRYVPMSDDVVEALSNVEHHGAWVFMWRGKPIKDIKTAWLDVVKEAELDGLRFHDLRHTFCSYAAMKGYNLSQIQAITGHKTLKMLERYTHLAPNNLVQVVQGLYAPTDHTDDTR